MPMRSPVLGPEKNKKVNESEPLSILTNLTDSREEPVPQFNGLFIPIPALLALDWGEKGFISFSRPRLKSFSENPGPCHVTARSETGHPAIEHKPCSVLPSPRGSQGDLGNHRHRASHQQLSITPPSIFSPNTIWALTFYLVGWILDCGTFWIPESYQTLYKGKAALRDSSPQCSIGLPSTEKEERQKSLATSFAWTKDQVLNTT